MRLRREERKEAMSRYSGDDNMWSRWRDAFTCRLQTDTTNDGPGETREEWDSITAPYVLIYNQGGLI